MGQQVGLAALQVSEMVAVAQEGQQLASTQQEQQR